MAQKACQATLALEWQTGGHLRQRNTTSQRLTHGGPPHYLFDQPVASHGSNREGATLTRPLGRTYGKKGTEMSRITIDAYRRHRLHRAGQDSDRRVAAFSTNRRIIHSSISESTPRGGVHHRVRATRVICNSNEQNHRPTAA